ncbi:MAG: polysaccharide biosynthesis protein [Dorea sp.]|jgi:FlaA1/EpsC-like NDP-sugar epimerase|nr:polysaccharide biosynthesis protein [Dorea sp.]GFI42673.1 UDP-N-acetyl-alpha-D-glucosamine C6 dehydratase [Lachnospiraceae bacterium]
MNKLLEGKGVPWVHQAILVAFLDSLFVVISYGVALILRFDFSFSSIPEPYRSGYLWSMPFWIASTIVVFYAFRLYHSIWRLASISELQMSIAAYIVLLPVYGLGIMFMHLRMPKAYYFMGFIISFCMTTALRFSYRMFQTYFGNRDGAGEEEQNRIMVIGGGAAGQTLIRELINSRRLHTKVCCVIDDNPNKIGRVLEGIPIVGDRNDILTMVNRYKINHIIYAIPATTGKNQKEILNICKETKCRLQTVPGVYQLVNGEVSVSKLRDVDIADLLGRAQVRVNNDEIFRAIRGRKVLVTGGGGSIGSELCRQIAKAKPKQLIIFDIYENNAYEIQQELRRVYPQLDLVVLIGSVRNSNRINQVMHTYKPDIVYHAAAHKHVPLMEDSPNEAIKNNVLGTYKTAMAAAKVGAKKFVLISTDKAVNPTNIMGASKRLCEMVVQMMNRKTDTDFVAVRFGNVLGSNGSVIPLFKKQIAEGGPVTVTDKDIIRYFMTIPEAVALVLQASYYAEGGEIFVLDMGDPVRIDDMARNLIRLSGYEPDVEIPIVYTGLRPGEKLYEELLMDEEGLQDTANEMIHIGHPIDMDDDWFEEKLKLLDKVSRQDSARIKEIVAEIVPTYHYKKK